MMHNLHHPLLWRDCLPSKFWLFELRFDFCRSPICLESVLGVYLLRPLKLIDFLSTSQVLSFANLMRLKELQCVQTYLRVDQILI